MNPAPAPTPDPSPAAARPSEPAVGTVLLAWEKLRILYNFALLLLVVVASEPGRWSYAYVHWLAPFAVVANVCFCAGPLGEWLVTALGIPRPTARWAVFGFGTAIAFALSLNVLIHLWPLALIG